MPNRACTMAQGNNRFNRNARAARPAGLGKAIAAALCAGTLLASCAATVDNRGYVPNPQALEKVKPGSQTRGDVAEILGTPSSVTPFSDDTWIYIQRKTETVAFFQPKVLEQNVVVVDFDDAGLVREVRRYTLEDGKFIDPVTRKTPAPGKELSLMEQLVGNIGRFSQREGRR
jgi:outer membrane protein assembly factor BamE (lipoprotein component of BamABCDE complex)